MKFREMYDMYMSYMKENEDLIPVDDGCCWRMHGSYITNAKRLKNTSIENYSTLSLNGLYKIEMDGSVRCLGDNYEAEMINRDAVHTVDDIEKYEKLYNMTFERIKLHEIRRCGYLYFYDRNTNERIPATKAILSIINPIVEKGIQRNAEFMNYMSRHQNDSIQEITQSRLKTYGADYRHDHPYDLTAIDMFKASSHRRPEQIDDLDIIIEPMGKLTYGRFVNNDQSMACATIRSIGYCVMNGHLDSYNRAIVKLMPLALFKKHRITDIQYKFEPRPITVDLDEKYAVRIESLPYYAPQNVEDFISSGSMQDIVKVMQFADSLGYRCEYIDEPIPAGTRLL